ncbi:MAG TPA: integrin alpha [Actinomycetes bacterium]|nr:integrin alpha [Actinomycetes bacterium]
MRRLAIVFGVVLVAGVCPARAAVSESSPAPLLQDQALQGDFNGDGVADWAIGAPGEDVRTVRDAGAVNVLYQVFPGVASQVFTQNSRSVQSVAEPGDRFGGAVAVGNFNGDGFGDLVVGVPFESVGAAERAGAVNVLYGSPQGVPGYGNQYLHQDRFGVGSSAESDDQFGAALATGDFNGDGTFSM